MASIENASDLESIENDFNNVWSSATIRVSLLEVEGSRVPNGEIVFHRESRPEEANTRYSIDGFEIYEERVSTPFDVVKELMQGTLQVDGRSIGFDFEHLDGKTSGFFQTGLEESRVLADRPRAELNTVFLPELPDGFETKYKTAVNEIDDRIKTADQPFFDLAKCEYYYFDSHFRGKSIAKPMVLVFADPEIRIDVDEENELELQLPVDLIDRTTIIAYPQRPYGERKGWKIPMADQEFQTQSGELVTYSEQLNLGELQEVDFSVYVGERLMRHERHYNPMVETDNDRFRIYEKYDQRGNLSNYLEGEDPNQFEVAVLNLLSIAGYIVQWFGEDSFSIPNYSPQTNEPEYQEIDIIAHAPDGSHIAFVECTNQRISEKTSLLDRMENVASDIIGQEEIQLGPEPRWAKSTVPCIATPQSPEQLSPQVVENLEEMGIVVLDREMLVDIYQSSSEQDGLVRVGGEPGFWWRERS